MRRFGRWAFNILAALSLLLFIAAVTLWLTTASRTARFEYLSVGGNHSWFLNGFVSQGAAQVWSDRSVTNLSFGGRGSAWSAELCAGSYNFYDFLDRRDGGLLAPERSDDWRLDLLCVHAGGFREVFGHQDIVVTSHFSGLVVPLWALAAMFLALPAVWLLRVRPGRRRRRLRAGLCTVCGYDLRATPDRCPECGHVPAAGRG